MQKGCDWILGNIVGKKTGVFGSDKNQIIFISEKNIEKWPKLYKSEVAVKLLEKVRSYFKNYNDFYKYDPSDAWMQLKFKWNNFSEGKDDHRKFELIDYFCSFLITKEHLKYSLY